MVVQFARHAVIVRHVLRVLAYHVAAGFTHEHAPRLLREQLHTIREVIPDRPTIRNDATTQFEYIGGCE